MTRPASLPLARMGSAAKGGFWALPRDNRLLMGARAARSVAQGALAADFALYLRALHWSSAQIGGLLATTLAVSIVLTLLSGPLSDRYGRKRFLIGYELACAAAALAALLSSRALLLVAATLVAGFGRGGNGTAGPFGPVESAWLAQSLQPEDRGKVYSLNSALGFVGMAAGALLAAVPAFLGGWLAGPLAYRPLFLLALISAVLSLAQIAAAQDRSEIAPALPKHTEREATTRKRENGLLLRLVLTNALQGAGIGLTGPLIAYWFALRFDQGPGLIGPLMAGGFILAALSSVGAGALTRRFGIVPVVIAMRLAGLALLIALPFAPTFTLAAALYLLRSMFNRGTNGARQALSMSLVRPGRRGLAGALKVVSLQIPRAIGPMIAGVLFEGGFLMAPFLIAAGFQGAYLVFYNLSFRRHDPVLNAAKA